MIYNFHSHTYHCGHASGTPEEYVQAAIAGGIQYMGFSEHCPYRFPNGTESGFRLPLAEVDTYLHEIRSLREKYQDQIDIKIGYEMEYYPAYFTDMLDCAKKCGAEYLILGEHFLNNEIPSGPQSASPEVGHKEVQQYVSCLVAAIESGVYSYIAHPDMVRPQEDVAFYQEEMRKICIASRECNIPLEINFLGIRDHRHYPNEALWEVVGQEKSPVTFGFDAHDVDGARDFASLARAKELVEKYHLNYIGKPELILLQ